MDIILFLRISVIG